MYYQSNYCNRLSLALLDKKVWWDEMKMLEIFAYLYSSSRAFDKPEMNP